MRFLLDFLEFPDVQAYELIIHSSGINENRGLLIHNWFVDRLIDLNKYHKYLEFKSFSSQ